MQGHPILGTLAWLALMFLLAAMITIVIFLSAVAPADRGTYFYVWMCVVCAGQFVFFAWAANFAVVRRSGRPTSGAVLQTIYAMIGIWLAVGIVLALVGSRPGAESSRFADNIAILYAVLTFLFLFGASALYARDAAVWAEDREVRVQRVELQVRAGDVDQLCRDLRTWGAANSAHLAAVDRLAKRLEAVRTSLDFAPGGKVGTLEEGAARNVSAMNGQIAAALQAFKGRLAELQSRPGEAAERLGALGAAVDQIDSLLRKRQQFLLIGGSPK